MKHVISIALGIFSFFLIYILITGMLLPRFGVYWNIAKSSNIAVTERLFFVECFNQRRIYNKAFFYSIYGWKCYDGCFIEEVLLNELDTLIKELSSRYKISVSIKPYAPVKHGLFLPLLNKHSNPKCYRIVFKFEENISLQETSFDEVLVTNIYPFLFVLDKYSIQYKIIEGNNFFYNKEVAQTNMFAIFFKDYVILP